MSDTTVKILGVKKQPNKNNSSRIGTTIYFESAFDDYSVDNASHIEGKMCGSEFTYSDIECHVGDQVELIYTKGFQDKAQLSKVVVIKAAAAK